jgi:hypothetical protein
MDKRTRDLYRRYVATGDEDIRQKLVAILVRTRDRATLEDIQDTKDADLCSVCEELVSEGECCSCNDSLCLLCGAQCAKCNDVFERASECICGDNCSNACKTCEAEVCNCCGDNCGFCGDYQCTDHLASCDMCPDSYQKYCKEGFYGDVPCIETCFNCGSCDICAPCRERAKCKVCDEGRCDACGIPCYECEEILCENHARKCSQCKESVVCDECIINCHACDKEICRSCIEECHICDRDFCRSCVDACSDCSGDTCEEHLKECDYCPERMCRDCGEYDNHGEGVCS